MADAATNATAIRDAVFARAVPTNTWQLSRTTDVPTLSGADLPALQVLLLSEDYSPDGDANVGVPRYVVDATIGISIVRGFTDPVVTDGDIDADANAILNALLCDPTFVGIPPAGQTTNFEFEAITRIKRRRIYAEIGETYVIELRLELTFQYRCYFAPTPTVPLTSVAVTVAAFESVVGRNLTPAPAALTLISETIG